MTTKQQSGFGVVPIIVIVAAVVVLGFVGYKVYDAQSKKQASNNVTVNNQTSPANSQPNNNQTSVTPAQADPYFHIKELGIKIRLGDGIKDVVYSYSAPTSQTYATFGGSVYVSTKSVADKDANCDAKNGPLGAIVKLTGNEDGFGNTLTANSTTIFKLESAYYRYEAPQAVCSNSESVNALISEQKTAFRDAFKTVQLDN